MSGARRADASLDLAVIGAGFGGIGMAIALRAAGRRDFAVIERAGDLGGTWRDNRYPGCACDVPSHLYSYSFVPKPDWSHRHAGWAEIPGYLRDVATRHGVLPCLRRGRAVTRRADPRQLLLHQPAAAPQPE